jgi:YD repeat-containing protein
MVIGALVATTTCASRADYGPEAFDPPELVYLHDAAGRLLAVADPEGQTASYRYDAVGNLLAVERSPSDELSVIGVVPPRAPPGTEVVVSGTGFDERASRNTVTFGGEDRAEAEVVEAEVVEAGRFELTVVVPEGAASGPVRIEASGTAATGPADFVVEPDRRPVVDRVSPPTVAAGDEVRIEGRNFTGDPLLDQVVVGGTTYATVTSASETELVVAVPPTAPSGRVAVATPHGTDRSDETLVVAPLGYAASDVGGLTRTDVGEPVQLDLSGPGGAPVELVAFEGRRGDAVALSLAPPRGDDGGAGPGPGCSDVAIGLVDPAGVGLVDPRAPVVAAGSDGADPWCAAGPPDEGAPAIVLPATGPYTVTVEARGSPTGPVELSVHEAEHPDRTADPADPDRPTGRDPDPTGGPGQSGGAGSGEGPPGDSGPERLVAGVGGPLDGFAWVPVDLGSGALVLEETDMVVADVLPVALTRRHRPVAGTDGTTGAAPGEGAFGLGSALELDLRLRPSPALQYVQLVLPGGLPVVFDRTTGGTDRASAVFEHGTTPTGFFGATITWGGAGWDLRLAEGTTLDFGPDGALRALRDRNGNAVTLRRDDTPGAAAAGGVTSVHSPAGRVACRARWAGARPR